jgi:hypothetical protein
MSSAFPIPAPRLDAWRSLCCGITTAAILVGPPALADETSIDFEGQALDQPPSGFVTTGTGREGEWLVQSDPTAPSGSQVLVQVSDAARGREFPLAILDAVSATDVRLSVSLKPLAGREDQAGGLVWRYADEGNYYVVRANALEGNVVLYKVENGTRTDLPLVGAGRSYGVEVPVPANDWSSLAVDAEGDLAIVRLNGEELFQVRDSTFADAGKVGLWTKADSVTAFDDFVVTILP